jgi:peptidoglycan/xylan/chitin deacetylase (PgdA/CDA1 family)
MRAVTAVLAALLIQLFLVGSSSAHLGKGVAHKRAPTSPEQYQPRKRSNHHHNHVPAQKRRLAPTPVRRAASTSEPSNEPSEASITSAAKECSPYNVAAVDALAKSFPTIWDTATIVSGDTAASAVWSTIQASGIIPTDVAQKGTGGLGDFDNVKYDSNTDPDCWWTETTCHTPKHKGIPDDIWQCAEPDTWGLTFDDGPNCSHNAFYDFLQTNNQKATMFYIGSNVMDWPLEAQRGIVDGHHICVHTWSHQYMTQLTDVEVFAELYYTAKAIKDIAGITPRCWRPPYGDVDDRVRAIATGLGMSTNIWSEDTNDWEIEPYGTQPKATIDANYASIIGLDYSEHGNIVLTHEINGDTMAEMIEEYATIKNKFKNIVPLTACMNISNPYPEDIVFPTFAEYVAGNVMPVGLPNGSSIEAKSASYSPVAYAAQTTTNALIASASSASGAAASSASASSSSSAKKSTSTQASTSSGASSSTMSRPSVLSYLMFASLPMLFVLRRL